MELLLLQIKGVGLITAATFVGEIGDVSRFQDPRQIQKLAFIIQPCILYMATTGAFNIRGAFPQ